MKLRTVPTHLEEYTKKSSLVAILLCYRSLFSALFDLSCNHHPRVFIDCLINPLQDQMEEWKRVANTLDKDHAKGRGYTDRKSVV